ncbi:MAG: efflux RND transporter permease subunit [Alistipes indistinctus]
MLPIFAFQKVEGKMFSPLAYTLGFALLGALAFTLTLVPVLSSMLLNKNVREKKNRFRFHRSSCDVSFSQVPCACENDARLRRNCYSGGFGGISQVGDRIPSAT